MTDQSYTTTITFDRTAHQVFDAIGNVRGWWSGEIDGSTANAGDEFDYRFEDVHSCRIRVTAAVPGRKVSWLVLENHFNFTQDKSEWTGTTIDFDLTEDGGRTRLTFTHHGLVPEYECFELCIKGWDFYITTSLANLINAGEGQPNATGQPRLAHEAELSAS
jgi:hypothetical protein